MPNDASSFSPASSSRGGEGIVFLAWLTVALLWPVALLNYLDRQMMASMSTSVMQDIPGMTEERWGFMLGLFKWVYAGFSPFGGIIADRFSKKLTICGSLFVWSLVTLTTGLVTTYEGLLCTRALMGLSEAFYIPAALALISDYHSSTTKSRAVGIHQTAIYCGVILGGFGGYAADSPMLGWRSTFQIAGIVGMLYAFPLLFGLRNRQKFQSQATDATGDSTASGPTGWEAWFAEFIRELWSCRAFLLLVVCFTLPAIAGWVIRDWMPKILKVQFGIGQGMAGVSATLYVSIASLAGAFIGGALADRWMKSTLRGRTLVSALGLAILIPALFGIGYAPTLLIAILFLSLFGIGWGFFDCNNMPILSQIVRPHWRATGYGIMNCISISVGGLADWGFGIARDRGIAIHTMFALSACLTIVSVILMLMIKPRKEIIEGDQ